MEPGTARLSALTNEQGSDVTDPALIYVQFNPETLDLTYTNTTQKGQKNQPPQVITETKSQLSYDLIFDTTLSGVDVRTKTYEIAKFMDPRDARKPTENDSSMGVPSKVLFEWGTFKFEGYIDDIKEKLDFFSNEGVPLRSTLSVGMSAAQKNLLPDSQNKDSAANDGGANDAVQNGLSDGQSITDIARQLGDEGAGRMLAAANGIENMRLPEVDDLVVLPNIELRASASFNSQSNVGGSISSDSVFGGLKSSAKVSLEPKLNLSVSAGLSAGGGVSLGAGISAGISLKAEVGVDADFEVGIKFEEC